MNLRSAAVSNAVSSGSTTVTFPTAINSSKISANDEVFGTNLGT